MVVALAAVASAYVFLRTSDSHRAIDLRDGVTSVAAPDSAVKTQDDEHTGAPETNLDKPDFVRLAESLAMELRVERADKIEKPDSPLVESVPALADLANQGDAVAAYQLYLGLEYCTRQATSKPELQARIDRVIATKRYASQQIDDPREAIAEIEGGFEYCQRLTADAVDQHFGWLELAAELGLLQAMVTVGVVPPPGEYDLDSDDPDAQRRIREVRETAAQWRIRAAELGSVDALRWLAHAHQKGTIIEHDPTRAYAYMLAATTAEFHLTNKIDAQTEAYLALLKSPLKPAQIDSATRIARSLLSAPACCTL